jgi:hypothetical protein
VPTASLITISPFSPAGYFSLVNEKGTPTAALYTTMIQLVRERVYKFLSVDNMQAYTESNPGGV